MNGHHMGPGMDIVLTAKRLKEASKHYETMKRHVKVLACFVEARDAYSDFYFRSFKSIAKELHCEISEIRRSARYLARRGLAEYQKGLFWKNGSVAGSGYAATSAGSAVLRLLEDKT